MTNAIEVRNLSKRFSQFQLENVTFQLPKGTIMGFVGENGAGKTTTIKCLLNLLKKEQGEIKIFGLDHVEHETEIKEQIGVVFDDLYVPDILNPTQINNIFEKIFNRWDENFYVELLKRFKIPFKKPVKQLSRGMRMKLSIAMALAHHPKLLILDEPTSGLDPIVRDEILDLFMEFIQDEDNSILFSTHITSDLEKIADYITFIHEGKIVFSKNKDELLYNYGIWKGTAEQSMELPEHAKVRMQKNAFGVEILVDRKEVNSAFTLDKPSIEEIMLFFVKGVQP
ncbi:MAG: ABC transporter ATP-binding protein [Bacilli bacterium]|jgi:ABC-2 type transport system ATP-binding protein|uniref:ABC transporter ATP-binding protein n=1 Tax=Ureibacillus suwonensis TaxID=313007 RepID=A0ABW0R9H8_9BACL